MDTVTTSTNGSYVPPDTSKQPPPMNPFLSPMINGRGSPTIVTPPDRKKTNQKIQPSGTPHVPGGIPATEKTKLVGKRALSSNPSSDKQTEPCCCVIS